jgi:hypothetical protein
MIGYSSILMIVLDQAFPFSLRIRADLFCVTLLGVYGPIEFPHICLCGGERELITGRLFLSPTVRRENLFVNGRRVSQGFRAERADIDLMLSGEVGIGF